MTDVTLRILAVVIHVACILVGECGGTVPEAGPAIAAVAMNRLEMGWGWRGWNAIADEPEPWAMDAAWEAYWQGGDASGDLFALSDADCKALGVTWGTRHGNERWGITVTRRWPK